MNFLQMEYFSEVAQTGSVSKAAEKLHVSQPAVSNMIKKLENELGFKLFDRHGNTICLNSDGKEFYKSINSILEILARNKQRQLYSQKHQKEITICFISAEAPFLPVLIQYMKDNPHILFRILSNQNTTESSSRDILDFLVWSQQKQIFDMNHIKIPYQKKVFAYLILPKNTPLSQEPFLTAEHLKEYLNICKESDDAPRFVIISPTRNSKASEHLYLRTLGIDPKIQAIIDDRFLALSLAAKGDFWIIMPEAENELLIYPQLVSIPIYIFDGQEKFDSVQDYFHIGWKHSTALSEQAADFLDYIMTYYQLTDQDIKQK